MGDQKDHATIQKKENEIASNTAESQDFESATESIAPPSLQLKSEPVQEKENKEVQGGETEMEGAFQFALASPTSNPSNESSKTFNSDTVQKKGVAQPFKMPIVQKKEIDSTSNSEGKPSFKL